MAPKGLIPAYAGRTVKELLEALGDSAHPRLRGADTVGLLCR